MSPIILHVDMDAFFAAIEERDNPHLKGKSIVVGADPRQGEGRGVVSTANYEARKFGIKSAMPISWAYRANPNAIFLPVDMPRYKRVSETTMEVLRKYADRMEQVSLDEAYLELAKITYEKAKEIAQAIKNAVWEKERLTCSIGVGLNKLITKIASDQQKPDGLTVVEPDQVQSFLDPKPIEILPGIGPKTAFILKQNWKVKTISDLRKIQKETLVNQFGKNGEWIFSIAQGKDDRMIEERHEIKSVGRQATFQTDTDNSQLIIDTIFGLLEEMFEELQERKLKGNALTLIVRYAGFETHTSQKTFEQPLSFETAKPAALKLLLPYLGKKSKIRLVGVRLSGFGILKK